MTIAVSLLDRTYVRECIPRGSVEAPHPFPHGGIAEGKQAGLVGWKFWVS
jgi:hypothetical protein